MLGIGAISIGLAVFNPARKGQSPFWAMPPRGVSKIRQALVQRFEPGNEEDIDLIAWLEWMQDSRDRMIEIYPADKNQARLEVMRCWREYFGDIISKFRPKTGWPADTGTDWKRVSYD